MQEMSLFVVEIYPIEYIKHDEINCASFVENLQICIDAKLIEQPIDINNCLIELNHIRVLKICDTEWIIIILFSYPLMN